MGYNFEVGDKVCVVGAQDGSDWNGVEGHVTRITDKGTVEIGHTPKYAHRACPTLGEGRSRWLPFMLKLIPSDDFKVGDKVVVKKEPLPSETEIEDYMQRQMRSPEKIPFPSSASPQTALQPNKDAERYLHAKLIQQAFGGKHPEVAASMKKMAAEMDKYKWPTFNDPAPLPNNGWMPAGTYLPIGFDDVTRVRIPKPALPYQSDRIFASREFPLDGCEKVVSGISAKIPLHTRRLPSRTLTWSNLGDEYDLLPDAE